METFIMNFRKFIDDDVFTVLLFSVRGTVMYVYWQGYKFVCHEHVTNLSVLYTKN